MAQFIQDDTWESSVKKVVLETPTTTRKLSDLESETSVTVGHFIVNDSKTLYGILIEPSTMKGKTTLDSAQMWSDDKVTLQTESIDFFSDDLETRSMALPVHDSSSKEKQAKIKAKGQELQIIFRPEPNYNLAYFLEDMHQLFPSITLGDGNGGGGDGAREKERDMKKPEDLDYGNTYRPVTTTPHQDDREYNVKKDAYLASVTTDTDRLARLAQKYLNADGYIEGAEKVLYAIIENPSTSLETLRKIAKEASDPEVRKAAEEEIQRREGTYYRPYDELDYQQQEDDGPEL